MKTMHSLIDSRVARRTALTLVAALSLLLGYQAMRALAADKSPQKQRASAIKAKNAGNFKDAYNVLARLATDRADDAEAVPDDLTNAINCLQPLGRDDEIDGLLEQTIAAHAHNWRLLQRAARSYQDIPHQGYIVAGKYYRGGRHGADGRLVNSFERDRVRALQLMRDAARLADADNDHDAVAKFYFQFADMLLDRRYSDGAWRLQYLTDLSKLPDYEDGYGYGYFGGGNGRGAPVDEKGQPVFHTLPKSWDDARTDGQRWRWCLQQAADRSPRVAPRARFIFASFLQQQFGVQTMQPAQYPIYPMRRGGFAPMPGPIGVGGAQDEDDDTRKNESGPYAVSTLKEDETIARLANGIKRFALPDEFNFLKLYKSIAAGPNDGDSAAKAADALAGVFANREQYDAAADAWKSAIQKFGPGNLQYRQRALEQIVGNWGAFESTGTQPAGAEPRIPLRFRNASKVRFTAQLLDAAKLLDDVKAYIKTRPNELEWRRLQIENIGYRIVQDGQEKYVKKEVARWELALEPRTGHFDKRVWVKAPIKDAGAYLLTAKLADGNETRIVVWVADTGLVKKPVDHGAWCYVADANSGQPIAKANVAFFGYRQTWQANARPQIETQEFADFTSADGQVIVKPADPNYQWLVTATTPDGRFAYLGFTGLWGGWNTYDAEYNEDKMFTMTDRPVYRPGQTVHYKLWVEQAKYDQEGENPWAGRAITIVVNDPRGQKVQEKTFAIDAMGGFGGDLELPRDATLGVYQIALKNPAPLAVMGGQTFRVEEYKKPEYEVSVDAPAKPIALGEKFTATIHCKYYFGAPVTQAKVKYKVMRTPIAARWYPPGPWDWLFGPGYSWLGTNDAWYPGWLDWGVARPTPSWFPMRSAPPEVVSENEVPIGPDGTVKVEIDTAPAKALHGDEDHRYEITAEVTDESRRTITGSGSVTAARRPFKVYAWLDRGYYNAGEEIVAHLSARTIDGTGVQGKGELKLLKITYVADQKPNEQQVGRWALDSNAQGEARQELKAAEPGQYRLSYTVTDAQGRSIEGGCLFVVRGPGFTGKDFRFDNVELVPDKAQYAPGDALKLQISANHAGAAVLLFARPSNGIYLPPRLIRLDGKSAVETIDVAKKDMPNFFVEALTISDGHVYTDLREVAVPPESRVVNVQVTPSESKYKPGEKARFKLKLTDAAGAPVVGQAVISVYDKAVEYISGGSNVPEIKAFFWKWTRTHYPNAESSLDRSSQPVVKDNERTMQYLGVFGWATTETRRHGEQALEQREFGLLGDRLEDSDAAGRNAFFGPTAAASGAMGRGYGDSAGIGGGGNRRELRAMTMDAAAKDGVELGAANGLQENDKAVGQSGPGAGAEVQPTVRSNFADTAFWAANISADERGEAEVSFDMPQNLTTWKARVWTMASGTRVGEGSADVVTYKNLIIRLEAPRFFVQKDQVVLSAIVHNYLKTTKDVKVVLDVPGALLVPIDGPDSGPLVQQAQIPANGERRINWRVKAAAPGMATVRMSALTDEESDATEQTFPVYIHGMLKTDSFSGALRPQEKTATLRFTVPKERIEADSRVEIRYSPSVACGMVDALPYLVDYPYGCTEQTLNRFLPTVITQKTLLDMHVDLKAIEKHRADLNAQEIGDPKVRAADWKRNNPPNPGAAQRNPVFDVDEVTAMSKAGVQRLTEMQNGDGGWGWFSGSGEGSWPHTTALVVHGLQLARDNGVALVPGTLEKGVAWLQGYQREQVNLLERAAVKIGLYKVKADDLDAFVYMVLADAGSENNDMRGFLYRDRVDLAVYTNAMFGLALFKQGHRDQLDMILKNISQFVVKDKEDQTAYLRIPENNWWWLWYGSDVEADSYYLKLLSKTDPKGDVAPMLAKYLINNRKNASYWNSTRDTAIAVEALAEYIRGSGEDKPDMTVAISLDGKKVKEVKIDASNLFDYDDRVLLAGDAVTTGEHTVEFTKTGTGPLYFNAYVTNFTLEDPIRKTGLEIKVSRKFYKLVPIDATVKVSGSRGQALEQKIEKYQRQELPDLSTLRSGDLVEVELEIDSKNDYEYVVFEDMKAAGFEPVEVRSGYNGNDLNAYVEFRDDRVSFFARELSRGKHSVAYRLRAEIPGSFSALPTKASAMYAPELKANSDEFKVNVEDAPVAGK